MYNLQSDPRELNNLLGSAPAHAATEAKLLRGELAKLLARKPPAAPNPPPGVAPATRALLTSLGYLAAAPRPGAGHAGSAGNAGNAGPDPKDRVAEIRLYENANLLLAERRFDAAASILRTLLARDPHNTLARRDLGRATWPAATTPRPGPASNRRSPPRRAISSRASNWGSQKNISVSSVRPWKTFPRLAESLPRPRRAAPRSSS